MTDSLPNLKIKTFASLVKKSYELSAVPFTLAHTDGSLRETNKSVLMAKLDKKVDVQLKLPQVTTSTISIAHIFDDMALVHMTKSFGASTFD